MRKILEKTDIQTKIPQWTQETSQIVRNFFNPKLSNILGQENIMPEDVKKEYEAVLSGNYQTTLSEKALQFLVPNKIYELVDNPNSLKIMQSTNAQHGLSIIIAQKNQKNVGKIYEKYEKEKKKARHKQRNSAFFIHPKIPEEIRLHQILKQDIESWQIEMNDKILLLCFMKLSEHNPNILHIMKYDWEKWQGIGKDFYQNTLPNLGKNLWKIAIIWENSAMNIDFFTKILWRKQIKNLSEDEQIKLLWETTTDEFKTVQFL